MREGPSPAYPNGRKIDHKSWSLFLVFDQPITLRQVVVDGHGATLPLVEVKDRGIRHAVIVIPGDVGGALIDINILV